MNLSQQNLCFWITGDANIPNLEENVKLTMLGLLGVSLNMAHLSSS
jgi:hypothetical protein